MSAEYRISPPHSRLGGGLPAVAFAKAGRLLVLFSLLSFPAFAQDSFEEWLKQDQADFAAYNAEVTAAYDKFLEEEAAAFKAFMKAAGETWGSGNVWVPAQKEWVQYRGDLEERSNVNFEDGIARIQVVVPEDATPTVISDAVADAIETLVLSGSIDPIQMMRRKLFPQASKRESSSTAPPSSTRDTHSPSVAQRAKEGHATPYVYIVQKGDSLWKVSRNFGVSREAIGRANGIDPNGWLKIGQRLTIPGRSAPAASTARVSKPKPAAKTRDLRLADEGTKPLLERQVTMPDGTPVTKTNARQFAEKVAAASTAKETEIKGNDGESRRVISAKFPLVPDHVRVRAERFRPLVAEFAGKYGIYAPLVYAIMHSESSFNPRARSGVPAYGLMQLVPRSGARDAYRYVHKKDMLVSGDFLYNPRNNIELGIAYLAILDKRYFKRIDNPMNRMLCSVAAYNTGAGNVCKAFGAGTSLSRAAPVVNRMQSGEVYARLRSDLPYAETRNYIKKVTDRMPLYEAWK